MPALHPKARIATPPALLLWSAQPASLWDGSRHPTEQRSYACRAPVRKNEDRTTHLLLGDGRPQETSEGPAPSGLGPGWTQRHRREPSRAAGRRRTPKRVESPAPLQRAARPTRSARPDHDKMTPIGAPRRTDHHWVSFSGPPLEKERQDTSGTSGASGRPKVTRGVV